MNIWSLIAICKKYAYLGGACQDQLDDMLNDKFDDLNPNAVRYNLEFMEEIKSYLEDADIEELDEVIQDLKEKLSQ